jgi:phosphomethylpyrimidine synthase
MPMNALPSDLVRAAQDLSEAVTRPIPGSHKVYVQGSRPDLKVPMREVCQAQTPTLFGGESNPAITIYDTSGPYTDPDYSVDLAAGLPALRAAWIAERGDVEELSGLSSDLVANALRTRSSMRCASATSANRYAPKPARTSRRCITRAAAS